MEGRSVPQLRSHLLAVSALAASLFCAPAIIAAQTAANHPVAVAPAAPIAPAEPSPAAPAAELDDASDAQRLQALARRFASGDATRPTSSPATPAEHVERPAAPAPAEAAGGAPPEIPLLERQPLGGQARSAAADGEVPDFNSGASWLKTVTALGLVLGLIFALRWGWMRATGRPTVSSAPGVVEVLSRTAVAPRNHVLLLRVGGRILIVGDAGDGLRTLANVDDPDEIASLLASVTASRDNSITRNFSQMLSGFHNDYEPRRPFEEGLDTQEHVVDRARDTVSGLLSRMRVLGGKGGLRG